MSPLCRQQGGGYCYKLVPAASGRVVVVRVQKGGRPANGAGWASAEARV